MSTAIVVGIVVLLGGIVGVFLYLRAQKRKETEEREEAEHRAAIAEAEKEKAEFLRKQKAASDAEEMEKKIKAMKAESDAKIARLERSAREAEKRRMGRPRRQETPAGTKKERRNFREMLLMIATILFKPPPGISGGAPTKENIRKTKQVLATIREGTADKETVKRWKRAWKLAKIKIRRRKEKRARQLARLRERQLRRRPRGVAKVGHHPAVFMATVAMVLGISGAAVRKLSDRAKMGDRGAQMRLRNAGRKAKSIIRSDPRGAHRRAKQHAKRMMIHRRGGSKFGRRITSAVGKMQHRGPPRRMTGKTNRGGMRRGRFGRTGKFSKGPASLRRGRKLGKTHRGGPKRFGPTRRSLKRASKIGKTKMARRI